MFERNWRAGGGEGEVGENMRLSTYLQLTFKDLPDDYQGPTGESWTIGKERTLSLGQTMWNIFNCVANMYSLFTSWEEMNSEKDKFATWVLGIHWERRCDEDC